MTIEPIITIEFGQCLRHFLVEALVLTAAGCMLSLLLTTLWFGIVMRCLGSEQDGSGGDRH